MITTLNPYINVIIDNFSGLMYLSKYFTAALWITEFCKTSQNTFSQFYFTFNGSINFTQISQSIDFLNVIKII